MVNYPGDRRREFNKSTLRQHVILAHGRKFLKYELKTCEKCGKSEYTNYEKCCCGGRLECKK